jgi:hypothetical protein
MSDVHCYIFIIFSVVLDLTKQLKNQIKILNIEGQKNLHPSSPLEKQEGLLKTACLNTYKFKLVKRKNANINYNFIKRGKHFSIVNFFLTVSLYNIPVLRFKILVYTYYME